jgi:hypothetical protein
MEPILKKDGAHDNSAIENESELSCNAMEKYLDTNEFMADS